MPKISSPESQDQFYKMLFLNMPLAYAYHKIILDKSDKPIDYKFIDVNSEFERITGLVNPIGKTITELLPHIANENFDWIKEYGEVALSQKKISISEQYVKELNSWYSVVAYSPVKEYFVTIFNNVTQQKQTEIELNEKIEKLEQMNKIMIGRELKMVELKNQLAKS